MIIITTNTIMIIQGFSDEKLRKILPRLFEDCYPYLFSREIPQLLAPLSLLHPSFLTSFRANMPFQPTIDFDNIDWLFFANISPHLAFLLLFLLHFFHFGKNNRKPKLVLFSSSLPFSPLERFHNLITDRFS